MDKENIETKAREMKASARRISWPTPKKTMKNTGIVLGWTAAMTALVFVADMISEAGFQLIINLIP